MIRVLPCLFVANFALVSSADLSDRVVDFGTVRAGTWIKQWTCTYWILSM